MSKTGRMLGNKLQQNISRSTQKVVSQRGKNLSERSTSQLRLLTALLLVVCATVSAAHWPALSARALSFDDHQYLTDNLLVRNPGWTSAQRFLTEVLEPSTVEGYYQPLTMISLMADYAMGGRKDNLRPFHRTSLALHVLNTGLVIVLLYLLFGRAWIAAGVGLLFGLHPITVELICWVSDRKDLLASFFTLWCLILYVHFNRKSDWKLYAGSLVMYVLALMSKPTSVPLPVLMLLMDFWPLRRLRWRAVVEKLPFFAVGGILAVVTVISQGRTALVVLPSKYSLGRIPLILCHNIIFYLHKIVWPAKLSLFYAYPEPFGLSDPMVLAGVIGTCILIPLLLISLRWTPAVLTGWLLFFAAIFPTMGLIGFTNVISADRYTYLPSVGLLMVLAALLAWFCSTGSASRLAARRTMVVIVVLILAGAEAVATRRYLAHWRETVGFCEYMLTVTPDAAPVHNSLGFALQSQGKLDEAISHYRQALRTDPGFADVHNNLAIALETQNKFDEAISHYRQALQVEPDNAKAHNNLGIALQAQGKFDEAISHFRQALYLKPNNPDMHNNLGNMLSMQGRFDEAISHFRQSLQINPDDARAHSNLGNTLLAQGRLDEAISHYRQAVRIAPNLAQAHYNLGIALQSRGKLNEAISYYRQALRFTPDFAKAHNNLAWILATHPNPKMRDASQAIEFAERAARLTKYQNASILDTLATAYAAAGQFDRAVTTAQTALALASAAQNEQLANHIRKRLELYKQANPVKNSTTGKHPGKEKISNEPKP